MKLSKPFLKFRIISNLNCIKYFSSKSTSKEVPLSTGDELAAKHINDYKNISKYSEFGEEEISPVNNPALKIENFEKTKFSASKLSLEYMSKYRYYIFLSIEYLLS